MFRLFQYRVLSLCIVSAVAASATPGLAQQRATQPIARAKFLTDMDAEFRKMDADKNGIVTRLELTQFRSAVAITEARSRNLALFARLDADRNGHISQAEFAKMVVPTPPPNVGPTVAQFDLDKDQSISLIEYRTRTLDNFDKLDADKDGYVSGAEMRAGGIGK